MATKRTVGTYFCRWCADHGSCGRCSGGTCECAAASHTPTLELGRIMLRSVCPDMGPAIMRGVYDVQLRGMYDIAD